MSLSYPVPAASSTNVNLTAAQLKWLHYMSNVCYNMYRVLLLQTYDPLDVQFRDDFFSYLAHRPEIAGQNTGLYDIVEKATAQMFIDYYGAKSINNSLEELLSREYIRRHPDQTYDRCWVYYLSRPESGGRDMRTNSIGPFLEAKNIKRDRSFRTIFLLAPQNLNKDARGKVVDIKEIDVRQMDHMQYDVAGHIFQPHVRILTKHEIISLAATSGLTFDRLPRIQETDPLMRDYGAKSGDVIHVLAFDNIQEELSDVNIQYMTVVDGFVEK